MDSDEEQYAKEPFEDELTSDGSDSEISEDELNPNITARYRVYQNQNQADSDTSNISSSDSEDDIDDEFDHTTAFSNLKIIERATQEMQLDALDFKETSSEQYGSKQELESLQTEEISIEQYIPDNVYDDESANESEVTVRHNYNYINNNNTISDEPKSDIVYDEEEPDNDSDLTARNDYNDIPERYSSETHYDEDQSIENDGTVITRFNIPIDETDETTPKNTPRYESTIASDLNINDDISVLPPLDIEAENEDDDEDGDVEIIKYEDEFSERTDIKENMEIASLDGLSFNESFNDSTNNNSEDSEYTELDDIVDVRVLSRTPSSYCSEDYPLRVNFVKKTNSAEMFRSKGQNRKSWSFSNAQMRDIERTNQILLKKILTQKPTYAMHTTKTTTTSTNEKYGNIMLNPRTTSAAVNRKKQQRQIEINNLVLKRKIEAISSRRKAL